MNEQNKPNENLSLLKRLFAKFHKSQIIKSVAGLAIAGSIALSMAGCDYDIIIKPKDPSTDTNPPVTDTTSPNNNSNDQSQLENYSELLQNVLTNDYYNSLIDSARAGNDALYETPNFRSIPYAFLEDEGYDVNAIRSGEITCFASAYVINAEPNNLYVKAFVSSNTATPYYTQYLLKYELTDQEMKDYHMLHDELYIQACFINDMISQMKTPTIISENKITIDAYNNLKKSLAKYNLTSTLLNGADLGGIILKSFDKDAGEFEVIISTGGSIGKSMIAYGYMNTITLLNGTEIVATNEDGAFYTPSRYNEYWFREDLNTSPAKSIIIYQPYADFLKTHTQDLDAE